MIYLIFACLFLFYGIYYLISAVAAMRYREEKIEKAVPNAQTETFLLIPLVGCDSRMANQLISIHQKNRRQIAGTMIIAQQVQEEQIDMLSSAGIVVKAFDAGQDSGNPYHRVLRFAAEQVRLKLENPRTATVILLDPDNDLEADATSVLLTYRQKGSDVVQLRRRSVTVDNAHQTFDDIAEQLNDFFLRRAKTSFGVPELSGSGIAFHFPLFEAAVNRLDPRAPGMDKNLLIQMLLLNPDAKISYVHDTSILDEKTGQSDQFDRQRRRWFGNQYFNAWYWSVPLLKKAFQTGQFRLLDYPVVLWRPPRSVQLVLQPVFLLADAWLYFGGFISFPVLSLSVVCFSLAIFLFLFDANLLRRIPILIAKLPGLAFRNLTSAIQGSRKKEQGKFIKTRG